MPNSKSDTKSKNKLDKMHKIALVKTDGSLFERVKEILEASQTSTGYEVDIVSSSDYIDYLTQKNISPPSFVICLPDSENNYKNIFKKVKEVFPETRRMLITESDRREIIIESLNVDIIHYCLALPFDDSEFLELLKTGFNTMEQGGTWEYIKRILDTQNVAMYKSAKSFNEKSEALLIIANQKKEEYKRSKLEFEKSQEMTSFKDSSLEKYISSKNISLQENDFKDEFKSLAGVLTKVFEEIALKNEIGFSKDKYSDILKRENRQQVNGKGEVKTINRLLEYVLNIDTSDSAPDSELGSDKALKPNKDKEKIEKKNDVKQSEPSQLLRAVVSSGQTGQETETDETENFMTLLDNALEFTVDEERLKVQITLKDKDSELLTSENIFEYLRLTGVSYGLINEQTLITWLENRATVNKLIVAEGTPSEQPVDGKVVYHFDADFIHAGTVNKDGSMDFRDRGSIPFVEENALLAEKTPAKLGKPGIDISGAQLAVAEPVDPVFVAGDNTFESEGGMKIFAQTGGQPHLDAMQVVSVAPVLNINSNVDYETGNISFKGSIVVNGAIKEGFTVEGTNLTAEQIEGAAIIITGDLNVSSGIIDSNIKTQGNIQAKYINSSNIETFGDVAVTTEVLDSTIALSGKFNSGNARIIGSKIVAKGGVEAGQIGTMGSATVKLRVGVDDYIAKKILKIDKKLLKTKEEIDKANKDIGDLNREDEKYFKNVSDSAYVQDRTQLEIKDSKAKLADIKESGNTAEVEDVINEIKKLEEKAVQAESMLEKALDNQDRIADNIKVKENEIEKLEEQNIGFVNKKKALKEYSEKGNILPRVIVNGKILAGTKVESLNAVHTVRDDTSRCKIEEIAVGSDGVVEYYEIQLTNL